MKVLLVIPKAFRAYSVVRTPHAGIAYLTAVLNPQGIEVKIFDMQLGYSAQDLIGEIKEFSPGIIGFTSYSYGYKNLYDTIDKIRNEFPGPIVVGGAHVSTIGKRILEDTSADFAIKGEGEETFSELIEALNRKEDYEGISGLMWRNNGAIVENADRPFNSNLDNLPFPDYSQFELDKYICSQDKLLPLITSRGCPYNCVYCSVKMCMGNHFRARSAENVFKEIESRYKEGWNNFDINDDCFNFDIERAMHICDLIIEKGLKINYQLYNGIRADRVTKELLEKMKQSGCAYIFYGVESGNNQILKKIRKSLTIEKIKEVIGITNEAGIENAAFFIIGHPDETLAKANDTIKLAKSLPVLTLFSNAVPYPGTDLYRWVEGHGKFLLSQEVYLNEYTYGNVKPIFETPGFTARERIKVIKKGFLVYRKKILKLKLGVFLGTIIFFLVRPDFIWNALGRFSRGTNLGIKMFRLISKRKSKWI